MKRNIVIVVVVVLVCVWVFILQTQFVNTLLSKSKNNTATSSSGTQDILAEESVPETKTQKQINQEKVRQKIEKIKKRLALKGLISQGDEYFRNDQLTPALKKYLQAHKQNKNDEKIIQKLGDTYFEMHRYSLAEKYYEKLIHYSGFKKEKYAQSILYQGAFNTPEEQRDIIEKLANADSSSEEIFYYTTLFQCLENFSECVNEFQQYREAPTLWTIETIGEENTQSYTLEITNAKIIEIKTAIQNYENFQTQQTYFKDALVIWALYQNQSYPLAIHLWKELLTTKNDYKPIIKIIADSYYELWDYENAKTYLSQYYEQDTSDKWVAYLLGVIHGDEGEHILSNIYLNKALENGYTPTINIRRTLIHNYFILESEENIIATFYDLIENEAEHDKSDLELAIYYYILYEKYEQARLWIQKGMEKYPTEENFHGYLGWIELENGNTQEAKAHIQAWLEINDKNTFLNYNMGRVQKQSWNIGAALVYFKRVIKTDPNGEFALGANKEIEALSFLKK